MTSTNPKPEIQNPRSVDLLTTGPLLSVKELAFEMKRHPSYVYAMRQAGFKMPGNRTTLAAAMDWLERNPSWRHRIEKGRRRPGGC